MALAAEGSLSRPAIAMAVAGLSESLGEGPTTERMHEEEIEEARERERTEKRATEGGRPTRPGERPRSKLAEHIPPAGDPFVDWFDSLTPDELERFLADESTNAVKGAAEVIEENIRHPGEFHEWLMVAEARKFKRWGVSMRTILEGRSLTEATMSRWFRHGGTASGRFHLELRRMIQTSNSYGEFLEKLNLWADRELVKSYSRQWPFDGRRGRYSLPDNLQLPGEGATGGNQ